MHTSSIGLYDFVGFGEIAETTTQFMAVNLSADLRTGSVRSERDLNEVEQMILQQARDYLGQVREGFKLSVRAEDILDRGELRFLIDRILSDWESVSRELDEILGLDDTHAQPETDHTGDSQEQADEIISVGRQLMAYGMAAVAMGALPRMPARHVTFPHSYGKPPTYHDIPVPSSPGDMLVRIQELEETLWAIVSRSPKELVERRYGPIRRTYGFFEASAFLAQRASKRFGMKRKLL